jgi:pimeloyl-ACP methyl ester carboxylesterase
MPNHDWPGTMIVACAGLLASCGRVHPGPSPGEGAMERTVAVQADAPLRMRAEESGTGAPLILIGGGLTGWASWEPHAARLSGTRRTVRLQLLSVEYGLADRALPEGYSVGTESRALAPALDALGLGEPLDLVAWSFGALVTLDFALAHPERVRSLVLIEPPALWVLADHGRDDPEVLALERLSPALAADVSEDDLAAWACRVGLCPPGRAPRELPQWPAWARHRRSLRNTRAVFEHADHLDRLRTFPRPVLLVTGTGTAPFLRRVHDTLARELPRARAVELPAGHAPQLVSMDRFLEEVAAFQAGRD